MTIAINLQRNGKINTSLGLNHIPLVKLSSDMWHTTEMELSHLAKKHFASAVSYLNPFPLVCKEVVVGIQTLMLMLCALLHTYIQPSF